MKSELCYIYTAYVADCPPSPSSEDLTGREWLARELTHQGVDSFTLTDADGQYKKERERSLVVDCIDTEEDPFLRDKMNRATSLYCRVFNQQSVLITRSVVTVYHSNARTY